MSDERSESMWGFIAFATVHELRSLGAAEHTTIVTDNVLSWHFDADSGDTKQLGADK